MIVLGALGALGILGILRFSIILIKLGLWFSGYDLSRKVCCSFLASASRTLNDILATLAILGVSR